MVRTITQASALDWPPAATAASSSSSVNGGVRLGETNLTKLYRAFALRDLGLEGGAGRWS